MRYGEVMFKLGLLTLAGLGTGAASLASCASAGGIDLRDQRVGALMLTPEHSGTVCPGEALPLIAIATLTSGEKLATRGAGKRVARWSSFVGQVTGGSLSAAGVLSVSLDPRDTFGRPVHVSLKVPFQAGADLDIPVAYDCAFWSSFNGADGTDGGSGPNGDNDSPGASGGNGGNGRDGDRIQVVASVVPGPSGPLLSVFVQGTSKQRLYYVDPVHGGSLVLRADGGDGGDGGAGGFGGSNFSYAGDGDGGDGGNGGAFIIRVSPDARPYMNVVHFENRGGRGGKGAQRGRDGMPGPPPSF
jgi:hypothetical protein